MGLLRASCINLLIQIARLAFVFLGSTTWDQIPLTNVVSLQVLRLAIWNPHGVNDSIFLRLLIFVISMEHVKVGFLDLGVLAAVAP